MADLASSDESLILCASPPLKVVAGCPNLTYPNPTSFIVSSFVFILGTLLKKSAASYTVISSTSTIFLFFQSISVASLPYRAPSHISHGTFTSGKNCISILIWPSPEHASHLPPFTLNENRPGLYPLILASGTAANSSLMGVNAPVYVAGFDRGVLPIGDWSIFITLSKYSRLKTPSEFVKSSLLPSNLFDTD